MSRLPFDPKRAKGAAGPGKPARREQRRLASITEAGAVTVTTAAALIKSALEDHLPTPLRVVGEVSNLSTPGHWYFSLKDEGAVLGCVAWASSAKGFGFTPRDGDEVVATGHVSHFPQQGRTQLYVSALRPVGAGALELRFRAMCEELRALGYFEEARKKKLPLLPRRVAVITSVSGAALQDVLATTAHRCPAVELLTIDVRVQGEGAAGQVARAIRWVDQQRAALGVDAVLVTRGGGSMEDLWAFNERVVADAAFACSLPLVAAIGHESDTTVIELVADVRAATPTQAAVRLLPARSELLTEIEHRRHRLALLMNRSLRTAKYEAEQITRGLDRAHPSLRLAEARHSLRRQWIELRRMLAGWSARHHAAIERCANRLGQLQPRTLAVRERERLAVAEDRLRAALRRRVNQRSSLARAAARLREAAGRHGRLRRERIEHLERHLGAVAPLRVLARGFSVTTDASGRLIVSVAGVRPGLGIVTRVRDGAFASVVSGTEDRRRGGKTPAPAGDQMDLFGTSG